LQIETGDIFAQISASGTVTFSDPPPQFTKDEVDSVLYSAQAQSAQLEGLELEMARSKEFISKVRTFLPGFCIMTDGLLGN
jgi:COP9 signalosome complex subunit 3